MLYEVANKAPLKKAVDMITGEPGDKVVLTVLHEGGKKPVDPERFTELLGQPSISPGPNNPA